MKKLIIGLFLLFSSSAYAGTISLGTISADATASGFNDNFTTIANVVNGNIEGSTDGGSTVSNVKADTLYEINMADDANPRVRDGELFNITVDTISGGAISSQGTLIESGCVQATDSDLTADVSACVAYINGYRVSKAATSQTYANNTTTYLWLSQTGVYTQSTNPDSTIPNSALLAKVVTSAGAITTVTNLFSDRVPTLVIPSNYRSGYFVSKDSTSTLTVFPGSVEINNTMLSKTSITTLNLATAGDYAGGSSLRAANTFGFVGVDASGNIKMHTTAPTHYNYAVSSTLGKKRYATWSSTVYRIIGWFFMDGGQLVEGASNIKEGDVPNFVQSNDLATVTFTTTTLTAVGKVNYYTSGGPLRLYHIVSGDGLGIGDILTSEFNRNGTLINGAGCTTSTPESTTPEFCSSTFIDTNQTQGTRTYSLATKVNADTFTFHRRGLIVTEE